MCLWPWIYLGWICVVTMHLGHGILQNKVNWRSEGKKERQRRRRFERAWISTRGGAPPGKSGSCKSEPYVHSPRGKREVCSFPAHGTSRPCGPTTAAQRKAGPGRDEAVARARTSSGTLALHNSTRTGRRTNNVILFIFNFLVFLINYTYILGIASWYYFKFRATLISLSFLMFIIY